MALTSPVANSRLSFSNSSMVYSSTSIAFELARAFRPCMDAAAALINDRSRTPRPGPI